jgi:hypothetical protein
MRRYIVLTETISSNYIYFQQLEHVHFQIIKRKEKKVKKMAEAEPGVPRQGHGPPQKIGNYLDTPIHI